MKAQSNAAVDAKKTTRQAYHSPKLRVYGNLRELTQSSGHRLFRDGANKGADLKTT